MSLKYFMFSTEQFNHIKNTEQAFGHNYTPGKVLSKGNFKRYTEILDDPKNSRYSDAKVVASGDIEQMTYTKSERK